MSRRLQWPADGAGWPHATASRLVAVGDQRWFVQRLGRGAGVLLIHGTGASAHSWRDVMPRLEAQFDVVAVDLPGHGFSSLPDASRMSLPGMAAALGGLLGELRFDPAVVVGHSAGAAIALRLVLDGGAAPAAVVSFNGALRPLAGAAGQFFAPLARLFAAAPGLPELFAWRAAHPQAVRRLVDGTGSRIDAEGVALYARLVGNPGHVQGALAMMAQWDLHALQADLPKMPVPVSLVVGSADRTVPPRQSAEVLQRLPPSPLTTLVEWPGLGHLAHEERPDLAADQVIGVARRAGRLAG